MNFKLFHKDMQVVKQRLLPWKLKVRDSYEDDVSKEPVHQLHSASLPPYVPTLGQEEPASS